MARTIGTYIEIDAPPDRVWGHLIDVARYPRWNPWTLQVTGYPEPGAAIELLTDLGGDGELRLERAVIRRWERGRELQWEARRGPSWLLRHVRVQRVVALPTGGCRYISEDSYRGLLAPLAERRERDLLRRAAQRMAAALKQRAEAAPDPDEDRVAPPKVSQKARDTFVLRGRFVAPPPAPPPDAPPDELAQLLAGYDRGITTYQSEMPRHPASKSDWQPCHACAQPIPVQLNWRRDEPGPRVVASVSYVCPRCHATQLGVEERCDHYDACHVCKTPLADDDLACSSCGMLRYWTCVACPTCGASQPVHVPHLGVHCDVFHLECVECETQFHSLCIC